MADSGNGNRDEDSVVAIQLAVRMVSIYFHAVCCIYTRV